MQNPWQTWQDPRHKTNKTLKINIYDSHRQQQSQNNNNQKQHERDFNHPGRVPRVRHLHDDRAPLAPARHPTAISVCGRPPPNGLFSPIGAPRGPEEGGRRWQLLKTIGHNAQQYATHAFRVKKSSYFCIVIQKEGKCGARKDRRQARTSTPPPRGTRHSPRTTTSKTNLSTSKSKKLWQRSNKSAPAAKLREW